EAISTRRARPARDCFAPLAMTHGSGGCGVKEDEFLTVFDPRGRVDAARVAPAPRLAALEGLRLGVLDNTKWNAGRLLRKTASLLGERFGFATIDYYRKESFSKARSEERRVGKECRTWMSR